MTSSLFENQNPSTHSLLSVDSATNHPSPSYQNEKKKKKKKLIQTNLQQGPIESSITLHLGCCRNLVHKSSSIQGGAGLQFMSLAAEGMPLLPRALATRLRSCTTVTKVQKENKKFI
jgi:hypothetical protein